jgi:hypothetical protein
MIVMQGCKYAIQLAPFTKTLEIFHTISSPELALKQMDLYLTSKSAKVTTRKITQ